MLDEAVAIRPGETLLVNGAGGVTGQLLVALGAIRGARVIATAGPASHEGLRRLGAERVLDYHDAGWVREARGIAGAGVDAAANAGRDQAHIAVDAVRDGGRLATITSDPPTEQRSIQIVSVYVRPDGAQLQGAVDLYGDGQAQHRGRKGLPARRRGDRTRGGDARERRQGGRAQALNLGDNRLPATGPRRRMSATAARPPAATEVDQWLERFGAALERGDAAGAAELFAQESYWRDLVAFTWNIKTVEGRAEIADMLEHTLGARAAARLARDRGAHDRRRRHRGVDRVRDRRGPRARGTCG